MDWISGVATECPVYSVQMDRITNRLRFINFVLSILDTLVAPYMARRPVMDWISGVGTEWPVYSVQIDVVQQH